MTNWRRTAYCTVHRRWERIRRVRRVIGWDADGRGQGPKSVGVPILNASVLLECGVGSSIVTTSQNVDLMRTP